MKKLFYLGLFVGLSTVGHAQNSKYLNAGNIRSLIGTCGHMWWDTAGKYAQCEYPKAQESISVLMPRFG